MDPDMIKPLDPEFLMQWGGGLLGLAVVIVLSWRRRNGNGEGITYDQFRMALDLIRDLQQTSGDQHRAVGEYHRAVMRAERDRLDMHEALLAGQSTAEEAAIRRQAVLMRGFEVVGTQVGDVYKIVERRLPAA